MDTTLTAKIIPILKEYGVTKASLFGSYARGDYDETSDIDILIEPPEGMGLEFFGLKLRLQDELQRRVDLVSFHGIDKYIKDDIIAYQKPIL